MQRGVANTRWRDFADVYVLTGRHEVDGPELQRAVGEVAAYRNVEIQPLSEIIDGYANVAQSRWMAWRRKQQLDDRVPEAFAEVVRQVASFADPALAGRASGFRWDASSRAWVQVASPLSQ